MEQLTADDLARYLPLIVLFAFFTLSAVVLLSGLFLLGVFTRLKAIANPFILLLYALFAVGHLTGSIVVWTNNSLNPHPPYPICLFSASASLANVPLLAMVVFSLVFHVTANVVFVHYPTVHLLFDWMNNVPFLLILPFITGLPIFFIGLAVGIAHPDWVIRGSPFYCTLKNSVLNIVSPAMGGLLQFICLVLAIWTIVELALIHYRLRSQSSTSELSAAGFNPTLISRVLLFSLLVLMCCIIAVIVIIGSFSEVIADVFFSTIGLGAVFIFGTTNAIISYIFRCRRRSSLETSPTVGTIPVFRPQLFELDTRQDAPTQNPHDGAEAGDKLPKSDSLK